VNDTARATDANVAKTPSSLAPSIVVRPLAEADLSEASRICSVAFGTFVGAPDPETFLADRDFVYGRWRADHTAAFGAQVNGVLVGSNFATNWGSVGFFGPLTIRPDLWDRGIGQHLVAAVCDRFDSWGIKHAGLYTFAQSPKYLALYQKFGFCARFLTAIMTVPASLFSSDPDQRWCRYSDLAADRQEHALEASRALADALYPGLDLRGEIRAVQALKLGDTVLLWDISGSELNGFAICHCGPRSEAGNDSCYIKFGAVPESADEATDFNCLLDACASFAGQAGMANLVAGTNLARYEAYRCMLARGFRTVMQGVTMHKPNEAGYSRPGLFIIDDWR
jgi:GNAT superfamily N-acetyltransferase